MIKHKSGLASYRFDLLPYEPLRGGNQTYMMHLHHQLLVKLNTFVLARQGGQFW